MGYASKFGRATASTSNPRAFAICDRCGFGMNHDQLSWDRQWQGTELVNRMFLVCQKCLDVPQENGLRAITLPPDPLPIQQPRVPNFLYMSTNYRATSEGPQPTYQNTGIPVPDTTDIRETQTVGDLRVTQQTGEPPGGLNEEPGTDPNVP